jgi:RNA polymerase primary sigma factor
MAHRGHHPKPKVIRTGSARDELALANRKLVWKIVRHAGAFGVYVPADQEDDAFQAGFEGLLKAATYFDEKRGYRFSTCAVWWIRAAIHNWMQTLPLVHVPDYCGDKPFLEKAKTDKKAAARLALALKAKERALPLPDPEFFLGCEDSTQHLDLDEVRECMKNIFPRWRQVLIMRYLESSTLTEVGKHFGVTRERVRQMEEKALARLRKAFGVEVLDDTDFPRPNCGKVPLKNTPVVYVIERAGDRYRVYRVRFGKAKRMVGKVDSEQEAEKMVRRIQDRSTRSTV